MKQHLDDIIQHTSALGFIELIKVTGTETETRVAAASEDRKVLINGKFKQPNDDFVGVFGMPNLHKLKTILGISEYAEDASITMLHKDTDDGKTPTTIHFENKSGDFVNDYRLMEKKYVEEKLSRIPRVEDGKWKLNFEPNPDNIQKMKKQAVVSSDVTLFTAKTEGSNLKFYFGSPHSQSGNFVFASNINGSLSNARQWFIKYFLAIMDLSGDKRVYINDAGMIRITVTSELAEYEYILLASVQQ